MYFKENNIPHVEYLNILLLVLYYSKHVFQSTAWEIFTKLSTVGGWRCGGVGAGSDQLSTETKAP